MKKKNHLNESGVAEGKNVFKQFEYENKNKERNEK